MNLLPDKVDNVDIKTGDVILVSKSSSILLKGMKFFQKDPVFFGHALIAKNEYSAYEAKKTIRISNIKEVIDSYGFYLIVRKKNFTPTQKNIFQRLIKDLVGRPYGFKRLLLQILDNIFHTTKFTKLLKNVDNQICSSLVAWIYYVLFNIQFSNKVWYSCDPDDIHDEITNNDSWTIISSNLPKESNN